MAEVARDTLKSWFLTGMKPTKVQFWNLFDSFFHKNDSIPSANIEGFNALMLEKADAEALTNHKTDAGAHQARFDLKQDKIAGKSLSENDYDAAAVAEVAKIANKANSDTPEFTGDVKLTAYPATRDDGVVPNNRVLGVDAVGNLKLFSVPTSPPPYLDELIPDSHLPNSTGDFIYKGDYFTPDTTVLIEGQTVNSVVFISSQELHVNVSTGSAEGYFGTTINNGVEIVFPNALQIVLGTVFKPVSAEWAITEPIEVDGNEVLLQTFGSHGEALWSQELDYTKDFVVQLKVKASPLGSPLGAHYSVPQHKKLFNLVNASDSTRKFGFFIRYESSTHAKLLVDSLAAASDNKYLYYTTSSALQQAFWNTSEDNLIEFRYVSGVMYAYYNNVLKQTFTDVVTENLKIRVMPAWCDVTSIKYIELAS